MEGSNLPTPVLKKAQSLGHETGSLQHRKQPFLTPNKLFHTVRGIPQDVGSPPQNVSQDEKKKPPDSSMTSEEHTFTAPFSEDYEEETITSGVPLDFWWETDKLRFPFFEIWNFFKMF
jgi:hypothetical protein